MDKNILKKIYDGQKKLIEKLGYTSEEINANYGYFKAQRTEANRNINYCYKKGFKNALLYMKELSPEERNAILDSLCDAELEG